MLENLLEKYPEPGGIDESAFCPVISGLWAGMEEAIHAVCELFDLHSDDSWRGLLVDAGNAFNSVNM